MNTFSVEHDFVCMDVCGIAWSVNDFIGFLINLNTLRIRLTVDLAPLAHRFQNRKNASGD